MVFLTSRRLYVELFSDISRSVLCDIDIKECKEL